MRLEKEDLESVSADIVITVRFLKGGIRIIHPKEEKARGTSDIIDTESVVNILLFPSSHKHRCLRWCNPINDQR